MEKKYYDLYESTLEELGYHLYVLIDNSGKVLKTEFHILSFDKRLRKRFYELELKEFIKEEQEKVNK